MVGDTCGNISVLNLSRVLVGERNLLSVRDNKNSRQNCCQLAAFACTWIISATEHRRFFPLIFFFFFHYEE